MIYIVDEKDIGVLSDGTVDLKDGDSVKVFVKDMEKPIFSARNYNVLSFLGQSIEFMQAASKEELIFLIGGFAGGGADCTLLQMDIAVPGMFVEHVKTIVKKEKPKRQRQPKKPKDVPVDKPEAKVVSQPKEEFTAKEPEAKPEPKEDH